MSFKLIKLRLLFNRPSLPQNGDVKRILTNHSAQGNFPPPNWKKNEGRYEKASFVTCSVKTHPRRVVSNVSVVFSVSVRAPPSVGAKNVPAFMEVAEFSRSSYLQ